MKNLRLGLKISGGFAVLILIAMAVSGVGVFNMAGVKGKAVELDEAYVNEVELVSRLQQNVQATMYNIRGYAMSEDRKYLEPGLKFLDAVGRDLQECRSLAERFPQLTALRENVTKAQEAEEHYRTLLNATVELNDALQAARKTMDETAGRFMENAYAFLRSQEEALRRELANAAGADTIEERLLKVGLINDVIDLGNSLRVANFKSQATWNPALIEEGIKAFQAVSGKYEELENIVRKQENKKQLAAIQESGSLYMKTMSKFLTDWKELRKRGEERTQTGETLLQLASDTSDVGLRGMNRIAEETVSSLNAASTVLATGALVMLILGVGGVSGHHSIHYSPGEPDYTRAKRRFGSSGFGRRRGFLREPIFGGGIVGTGGVFGGNLLFFGRDGVHDQTERRKRLACRRLGETDERCGSTRFGFHEGAYRFHGSHFRSQYGNV